MDTDAHGLESELTEAVIGSAFEVANVLKVYERAVTRELARRGGSAKPQISFPVCQGRQEESLVQLFRGAYTSLLQTHVVQCDTDASGEGREG